MITNVMIVEMNEDIPVIIPNKWISKAQKKNED